MKYFDRDGKEINYAEWHKLTRQPSYCNVLWTETHEIVVRTVWIGVQLDVEETKRLFCVQRKETSKDADGKFKSIERWFETAEQAVNYHCNVQPHPELIVKGNPYAKDVVRDRKRCAADHRKRVLRTE